MLKFFKVSLDFIELFYNFDMMLPCPVPLHHSGRSNVRCAVHTTTAYNVLSSAF